MFSRARSKSRNDRRWPLSWLRTCHTRIMRSVFASWLTLVASGLGVGASNCSSVLDQCENGSSRCEANAALRCYREGDASVAWHRQECGKNECVVGPRAGAVCSVTSVPQSECQTAEGRRICFRNHLVECRDGLPTSIEDCAGPCVETAACGPFCTLTGLADPVCTTSVQSACEGATAFTCRCGYRTRTLACRSSDLCRKGQTVVYGGETKDVAYCALGLTPDTQCGGRGRDSYCDGHLLTWCYDGLVVQRADCGDRECHALDGDFGSCVGGPPKSVDAASVPVSTPPY